MSMMKRLRAIVGRARALRDASSGNAAVLFAVTLPLVVAGAALAMETGYWYVKDRELQGAADAAAFAGAVERRAGRDEIAASVAQAEAVKNGFVSSGGTFQMFAPAATGPNAGDARAVEVVLAQPHARFFTALFFNDKVTARARAVARFDDAGAACVLALDPTAARAADFAGSSDLNLIGCTVMANSVAADAVTVRGAAKLEAPCLISVGGVDLTSGAVMTDCSSAITDAPPVADPFGDLVEPTPDKKCTNAPKAGKTQVTLSPGTYCGGLSLNGDYKLEPGVYVVKGGSFDVGSQAVVRGEGVTIYLAEDATVGMNGGADIKLSAPTSGTYSGILFFGARDNAGAPRAIFNGGANSELTGAIYFPTQDIDYRGNFAGKNGCTQVVGRTVSWSGNTSIQVDCAAAGMRPIPANQVVALVE